MYFRQTLTCERIVLIRRLCIRSHFRLLTRYARLHPRCAIFFQGRPSVRFRNELYSGANTRVSQVVAVIENNTSKSAGNQRTWHTITGNIAKQFDTLPLMSDDVGKSQFRPSSVSRHSRFVELLQNHSSQSEQHVENTRQFLRD